MIAFVATFSVTVFLILFFALRIVPESREVIRVLGMAINTVSNPAMTEHDREAHVRSASIRLFRLFLSILSRIAVSAGLATAIVAVFDVLGMADMDETVQFMSRWDVVAVWTAIFLIVAVAWRSLKHSQ